MASILKNRFILGLSIMIVLITLFLGVSVSLIVKTNRIKSEITESVQQVSLLTDVGHTVIILKDSLKDNPTYVSQQIQNIRDDLDTLQLDNFEVRNLLSKGDEIKLLLQDLPFSESTCRQKLTVLYTGYSELVAKIRSELSQKSEKLSHYWYETHLLLIISIVIGILFCVILIVYHRTRNKLEVERIQSAEMIANSIDAIMTNDKYGNVKEVNPAAEKMLGYTKKELQRLKVEDLYVDKSELNEVYRQLQEKGHFYGDIQNRRKDGTTVITRLSANFIYNKNGEIVGSMGISRDIGEEIRVRQEYRQLISNASDVIYSTDLQGKFSFINKTVEKMLGYTIQELLGQPFQSIVHQDYVDEITAHYQEVFKERKSDSYVEFQVIKKNGEPIWVGQHVKTVFSSDDPTKIIGFNGIVRNIDKRKKMEITLTESEERYRDLFDNSTDLIFSLTKKGSILYANATWKKALEYKDNEIRLLSIFDVISDDSQIFFKTYLTDIDKSREDQSIIFEFITKSGKKVTVEGTLSLQTNELGEESYQGFFRDITQQKKTEIALAKREKILSQITNTIDDVYFLFDLVNNRFEYLSPNCKDVLGVDAQYFYDSRDYFTEYVFEPDMDKVLQSKDIIAAGNSMEIDYRILIDGRIRWLNEKRFPIKDSEGKTYSYSGIARDVTELKEANLTIYQQNLQIGESIIYAKRIQNSVLPTENEVQSILPDSFVYYEPKDILSGDFYVIDSIKTNDLDELPAFIVADCTGHGVPGGVLSLLCNGLIKETFTQKSINTPAEALDYVREKIVRLFRANIDKQIKDGMDIAFCVLNKKEKKLNFSGANTNCVIIRKGELIEIKGDRQHVGFDANPQPFTKHAVPVENGDCIFLFTDGYIDQFGGEHKKKFMKRRFYELLKTHSDLPMKTIGLVIEQEFQTWKGDGDQTDDVTVFGTRLTNL